MGIEERPQRRTSDRELERLIATVSDVQKTVGRIEIATSQQAEQIKSDRLRTDDYNRLVQQTIERLQQEIDDARTTATRGCETEAATRQAAIKEIKDTLTRVWTALGAFVLTTTGAVITFYLTKGAQH